MRHPDVHMPPFNQAGPSNATPNFPPLTPAPVYHSHQDGPPRKQPKKEIQIKMEPSDEEEDVPMCTCGAANKAQRLQEEIEHKRKSYERELGRMRTRHRRELREKEKIIEDLKAKVRPRSVDSNSTCSPVIPTPQCIKIEDDIRAPRDLLATSEDTIASHRTSTDFGPYRRLGISWRECWRTSTGRSSKPAQSTSSGSRTSPRSGKMCEPSRLCTMFIRVRRKRAMNTGHGSSSPTRKLPTGTQGTNR